MTWFNREVFRVATVNETQPGSQDIVQVQFSVQGAVRAKSYVMTRSEFSKMRPNAQDQQVHFCDRKYIEPQRLKIENNVQKMSKPVFRRIQGKEGKNYTPTHKLVDDEIYHFKEGIEFRPWRLCSAKLDQISSTELDRRRKEVQGSAPGEIQPQYPSMNKNARMPMRPQSPMMARHPVQTGPRPQFVNRPPNPVQVSSKIKFFPSHIF